MRQIWIVTSRYGTEMYEPEVYYNEKEANKRANEIVLEVAREAYSDDTGGSINARKATIEKWADEKGCSYDDWYFWDGSEDAIETNVTQATVQVNGIDPEFKAKLLNMIIKIENGIEEAWSNLESTDAVDTQIRKLKRAIAKL